jgi:hypothetical protein
MLKHTVRNEAAIFVKHPEIRFVLRARPRFVETRVREMRVNSAEFKRRTRVDRAKNAPHVFDAHTATTHSNIDLDMHREPRAKRASSLL